MEILLWLGVPIVLIIIGIVLFNTCDYDGEPLGVIICLIGGIAIIVVCIIWPVNHYSMISEIRQFEAIQSTVEIARNNLELTEYERAALTHKIVDANKWLAKNQYWGSRAILDMFYPDEINELKPMK